MFFVWWIDTRQILRKNKKYVELKMPVKNRLHHGHGVPWISISLYICITEHGPTSFRIQLKKHYDIDDTKAVTVSIFFIALWYEEWFCVFTSFSVEYLHSIWIFYMNIIKSEYLLSSWLTFSSPPTDDRAGLVSFAKTMGQHLCTCFSISMNNLAESSYYD